MFPIKHTPALAGLTIILLCSSGITVAKDKALSADLAQETLDRMAADQALQDNINAEAAARIANDIAGVNAREAADDAERAARSAADAALQGDIDGEAFIRNRDDGLLQSGINTNSNRIDSLEAAVTSTMLYARSNTVSLGTPSSVPTVPFTGNFVMLCGAGDKVVGGSCKFSIDPVANGTVIVNDGPVPESEGFESWNCNVNNTVGIASIDVTTSSICMSVPPG